ncbi:hypothetical protein CSQ85_09595 [Bifidobacterium rousetti]|uniref:restriction endonuclease subunit S n=1 Tax=Bifidobacterium rousetti TaxID=2045439 RepID=UPI001238E180|nr:restriction endonuclease subunit S [Bifidobacterium rousetti]KAA8818094.1 hypothetical protein CSQ85_09595 [Bifidobacterium rousetti]
MTDSMIKPSKMKVNMSRNGDGALPRMVKLGDVLHHWKDMVHVDDPLSVPLISVKLHGNGAVRREIGDGKAPKPFTGNRGHAGQFVFSRIWARRGAMALIPEELDGVVVTNEFPLFDVDEEELDSRYLNYLVQTQSFLGELERISAGASGQNRVKEAAFLNIHVPLPSLEEQRRIVAVLDRADAIRAKRRQMLADLDELKQSLFDEMFLGTDFPIVESGDLMPVMRNGLSPSKRGTVSARVLTLSAITQGKFDVNAVKEGTFDTEPPADKRVTDQDFMMCRGNGNKSLVGVGAYSSENYPGLVFPDTIIAGRIDSSKILLPFLEMIWRSRSVRGQIEKSARTTNGTYKVNQQALSQISIPLPPIELQKEFARRVEAITAARAKVERALALDDELFAALQSRAFRGAL